MLKLYEPHLRWIDEQHDRMCGLVTDWANINSGTHNLGGLAQLSAELKGEFACLNGEMTEIPLQSFTLIDGTGKKIQ
jgi:hypothetical protein